VRHLHAIAECREDVAGQQGLGPEIQRLCTGSRPPSAPRTSSSFRSAA
jgi:hypothetical protein